MKRVMRKLLAQSWWVIALAVVAVLVIPVGGTVVAVKLIIAARGKREIFDQVKGEVMRQLEELRPDLTEAQRRRAGEILGAMAVHETNGGETPAWRQGWNWGNVTAGPYWKGPVIVGGDTEYDAAGNVKNISQHFRKYDSLAHSVDDFLPGGSVGPLDWKAEKEQGAWDALIAGDEDFFIQAIYAAHYFTQPVPIYLAAVESNLSKYGTAA